MSQLDTTAGKYWFCALWTESQRVLVEFTIGKKIIESLWVNHRRRSLFSTLSWLGHISSAMFALHTVVCKGTLTSWSGWSPREWRIWKLFPDGNSRQKYSGGGGGKMTWAVKAVSKLWKSMCTSVLYAQKLQQNRLQPNLKKNFFSQLTRERRGYVSGKESLSL